MVRWEETVTTPGARCDICSEAIAPRTMYNAHVVPAAALQSLVESGYNPFELPSRRVDMSTMPGTSRQDAYEAWKRVVDSDLSDWMFCEKCGQELASWGADKGLDPP
jgi:hypothetical protein